MTGWYFVGVGAGIDGRRVSALIAVAAAAVASIASLDEAAPLVTHEGSTPEQSVTLDEASEKVLVKLHATSTETTPITLTIHLKASWEGFADGSPGDYPIVEGSVAGSAASGNAVPETLDRAITTAPGTGELILSVETSCASVSDGCSTDFTFTLDRLEPLRSGPVEVTWSARASISTDATEPEVTVAVVP